MTLVELLVTIPLLGILFGLILAFVVPAWRAWGRSDMHSQAQENALVVTSRLVRELQYSNPDSVAVFNATGPAVNGQMVSQDAVSFLTDTGPDGRVQLDPTGSPLWQTRVVFYYDAANQGVRLQEQPVDAATDPQPVKASSFIPDPQDRILARNIRSLSIQATNGALPLNIGVESCIQSYTSQLQAVGNSLLNTVAAPNS